MIPALWYKILKLKKEEVLNYLVNGEVKFDINVHHMTLKSLLYRCIKETKSLKKKFREMFGSLEPNAMGIMTSQLYKECETTKRFKKKVLKIFHPDANPKAVKFALVCTSLLNTLIDDIKNNQAHYDNQVQWEAECAKRQAEYEAKREAERARWEAKREAEQAELEARREEAEKVCLAAEIRYEAASLRLEEAASLRAEMEATLRAEQEAAKDEFEAAEANYKQLGFGLLYFRQLWLPSLNSLKEVEDAYDEWDARTKAAYTELKEYLQRREDKWKYNLELLRNDYVQV